jgi:hypothetical protein
MRITLEVPDDVGVALDTPEFRRAAIESMAIEGYRAKRLSEAQIRRMLGFRTRLDVHAFFKTHDVPLHYTFEDMECDAAVSAQMRKRRASEAE